jgi:hypothetical protein
MLVQLHEKEVTKNLAEHSKEEQRKQNKFYDFFKFLRFFQLLLRGTGGVTSVLIKMRPAGRTKKKQGDAYPAFNIFD